MPTSAQKFEILRERIAGNTSAIIAMYAVLQVIWPREQRASNLDEVLQRLDDFWLQHPVTDAEIEGAKKFLRMLVEPPPGR